MGWSQAVTINYTCNVGGCYGLADYLAIYLRLDYNNQLVYNNYYGWIDFEGYVNPIIKDFAINMKPDRPIKAGQKE